jgi:alpha-glucosidase
MTKLLKPVVILLLMLICFVPQALGESIGSVKTLQDTGNGIELNCTNAYLSIELITPEIARVRLGVKRPGAENRYLEDYSYSIREDLPKKKVSYRVKDKGKSVLLSTNAIDVVISKNPVLISFLDKEGFPLSEDFTPMSWFPATEGHSVTSTKSLSYDEHFYGLGEKTGPLDKRRSKYEMWNTGEYGDDIKSDPIYQSHPFFIGLKENRAYGIFFDNTYRTHFDMGHTYEDRYMFSSEGGELDYYFIAGPLIKDVVKRYAYLTGYMPLPPMWALGHMICRWSYYPEKEVMDLAERARAERIPLDVIWLDIHYMDGYRCFTWDKSRFPNLSGMISKLHSLGYKVVSMIDPGIKADPLYFVFKEGIERDAFAKYPHGGLYIGKVWPKECVFPDFTRSDVQQWWGGLYKGLVDAGIDGFWNDMNEPDIFDTPTGTMDDNVDFHDFGLHSSHRKVHNAYGSTMAKATFEGVSHLMGKKRPFVLSRAGFSGLQRYAASWTGDNTSNFDHLRLQIPMFLNMGLSGTPFIGSDIGGFFKSANAELLTRWYQASSLVPLMREHNSRGEYDQEPWVHGDPYKSIIRKYINMRYRLLPYLYSCFYNASKYGSPIMRPLVYEYQHDSNTLTVDDEFLIGPNILVAPVLKEGGIGRLVYLPEGSWYDYETKDVLAGNKSMYYDAPLDKLPVFIKEGAIIPTKELGQYTTEKGIDTITLEVFPLQTKDSSTSILYMDDGETKDSPFVLYTFGMKKEEGNLSVDIDKTGVFDGIKSFNVKIYSERPRELKIDNKERAFKYEDRVVHFNMKKDVRLLELVY